MRLPFKQLTWNLVGGAWLGLLLIVVTPYYVSKVGLEGYGLISVWLSLQMLAVLFDFGLGATVLREMSKQTESEYELQSKNDVLKTIEHIFWVLALTVPLGLIFFYLLKQDVSSSSGLLRFNAGVFAMIAVALAVQFPYGLYFNALLGLQRHATANAIQISGNTLRYLGGAAILTVSSDLIAFFLFQSGASIALTLYARAKTWDCMRQLGKLKGNVSLHRFRPLLKYSLGMAATSIVAVLVSNVDRFSLGVLVPLDQFGKYSLALTAAGILQMAIQPMHRVYFPRYVSAISENNPTKTKHEYIYSCKLLASFLIPIAIVGFVNSDLFFQLWLGRSDPDLIFVFRLILIGVTLASLMWLPAAFQQANGLTWAHTSVMSLSLIIGIPLMIFFVDAYGIRGGPTVWLTHGIAEVTLGLWVMHRYFFKGKALKWVISVVMPPILASSTVALMFDYFRPESLSVVAGLIFLFFTGLFCLAASWLSAFKLTIFNKAY